MATLRYIPALGSTIDEMRSHMQASPLYAIGDCTLVWVNEGDFWGLLPTNVAAPPSERDRLRAALFNARSSLTAFGGDPSLFSEAEAEKAGADMMQWALLKQIDDALSSNELRNLPGALGNHGDTGTAQAEQGGRTDDRTPPRGSSPTPSAA